MADKNSNKGDDGEPDMEPCGKKRGGKIVKAKGKRPAHRLDKVARGGAPKKWMQDLKIKKGALHKSLGVPAGEKIPAKKLEKAAHSSNPLLKKRAVLAETFKKANKD